MRCKTARRTWIDVELELASRNEAARLETHLGQCPACAAWSARERNLTEAIAGKRVEISFPVDVTAGVLARIRQADPPLAGDELTARHAGWFSATAAVFGVVLLVGLWRLAPDLPPLAEAARATLSGMRHLVTGLGAPLVAFVSTLARSLGRAAASLQALNAPLQQVAPLLISIVGLCTAMMTTSILLVLRRDLTRPGWTRENGRA